MKILSAEQLYEADKITIEKEEITSEDLMERAGTQIFEWLHKRLQGSQVTIHIFCGIGNNGGDGLVVGRLLIEYGYNVMTYVVNCSDKRSHDFLVNYDKIKNVSKKWPILMKSESDFPEIDDSDIIIDGIFGIGLNRCPDGWVKALIQYLNHRKAFKLALDIPSGLFADKALEDKNAILRADHTLTFQTPKISFFLPETSEFVNDFDVLDIGLDADYILNVNPIATLINKKDAQIFYKNRKIFSHKGTYGHSLIVAGSYGKIGAALLSSEAAYRIGAGLVTAFVPKCGYTILQTTIPEAMVLTDVQEDFLSAIELDFNPTVVGIGMGIGLKNETVDALENLLKSQKTPMIIDADALNIISDNKGFLKLIPKKSILTPHPGELKRLLGKWKDDFDKLEKAKKFSKKHDVILVLKDAYTIIAFDDNLFINTTGNPGMATGGSGDVLSGVVTGLVSQGYDSFTAAIFGVYLHGRAGDIAAQNMGYEAMTARNIIENLGAAYLDLFDLDTSEINVDLKE